MVAVNTSARKSSKTVRAHPSLSFGYAPISLPEEFPFSVSGLYTQTDKEIVSLHAHDVLELGLCLDGSGIFVVDDKVLPFNGGDVCVITERETHLAQSRAGTVSHWHWLYADLERLLFPVFKNVELVKTDGLHGSGFHNIIAPRAHPRICGFIRELVEIHTSVPDGGFVKERTLALFCLLMSELQSAFGVKEGESAVSGSVRPRFEPETLSRLQRAVAHITRNYARKIKISELAHLSALSTTHFRRLFEEALGKSPMRYLTHVRLTMASAELVGGQKPVSQIADESGFPTISSFNRHFRAQFGVSPREWRKSRGA